MVVEPSNMGEVVLQVCQFLLEFADAVIDGSDPYGVDTGKFLRFLFIEVLLF